MKTGTTTLAQNHANGLTPAELEVIYGVTTKPASSFSCYKGIREKNAYGIKPIEMGGAPWLHAYLVDGVKKNDAAGNITSIEYHAVDPGVDSVTNAMEWRTDLTWILLQP